MSESDEAANTATAGATSGTDLSPFPVRQDLYDESYSDEEYHFIAELKCRNLQDGISPTGMLPGTDTQARLGFCGLSSRLSLQGG